MYCKAAKAFFKENNVEYTEYDVSTNAEKREEKADKWGFLLFLLMIRCSLVLTKGNSKKHLVCNNFFFIFQKNPIYWVFLLGESVLQ